MINKQELEELLKKSQLFNYLDDTDLLNFADFQKQYAVTEN